MVPMRSIILSIQRSVPLRSHSSQLTVIQTTVPADLHLAPNMHAQGIREFESVEECVGDYRRTLVGCFGFEESEIGNVWLCRQFKWSSIFLSTSQNVMGNFCSIKFIDFGLLKTWHSSSKKIKASTKYIWFQLYEFHIAGLSFLLNYVYSLIDTFIRSLF